MSKNLWKEIIENVVPLKRKGANFGRDVKHIVSKKLHDDIDVSFISFDDIKVLKQRHIIESDLVVGDESRVDKNLVKNFKKGHFNIDSKLDLHGKTLEKAFNLFVQFINCNYELDKRVLLVITGKGNPEKNTGIIRKNLPLWVNNESVKDKILYINYAHISDGGDGAFYILLRKKMFE